LITGTRDFSAGRPSPAEIGPLGVKRFVAQEYSLKVMSFFHSTACDSGETGCGDAPFGYWVLGIGGGAELKKPASLGFGIQDAGWCRIVAVRDLSKK